jgi:hypothetical protein
MKPSSVSRLFLFPLLVLVIVQFACVLGAQPPSATPQQPDGGILATSDSALSAPGSSNAGQIVISGAVNKTFAPVRVNAGSFGNGMRIYLNEPTDKKSNKLPDLITIDLTSVIKQPGIYPIEDMNNENKKTWAIYQVGDDPTGQYNSIKGTLTLTAAGSKYSGQFQFAAGFSNDTSKTIEVTGSFTDLPFNP